jgi:glutathionylspermidine synthase
MPVRYQPLPLAPGDFRERMERLRFEYGKWDLNVAGKATVPCGALVLTAREHAQVVGHAEALARAADHARAAIAQDPPACAALGVPPALAEAAAAEGDRGPVVTRIDFFRTRSGWQVSELNDDCPGGYNEAIGLPAVLADALPPGLAVPGDVGAALVRTLGGHGGRVGIAYATGYAEDLQVAQLLARLLAAAGHEAVAASPAHLETKGDRAALLGQEVGCVLRFFPAEWLAALPNWQAWRRLARSSVPVRNPLSAILTQSKGIHAWLRDRHGGVRDLLPATRPLDAASAAEALAHPHRSVLKPSFGRMGEGVVLGSTCPPELWRKRVAGALRDARTRPYVVQERFDAVPVETQPGSTRTACIGAYVVDGRFAGYYSRLAPGPVVAYDAANVLTVVEAA